MTTLANARTVCKRFHCAFWDNLKLRYRRAKEALVGRELQLRPCFHLKVIKIVKQKNGVYLHYSSSNLRRGKFMIKLDKRYRLHRACHKAVTVATLETCN